MPKEIKLPNAEHPITIEPESTHIVAKVGSNIIADTKSALVLREANYPPVYYLPLEDVDQATLRRSDAASYCPYKGDASYYSLVLPEGELTDAVWTYEEPHPAVASIAGYVAFYADRVNVGPVSE